MEDFSLPEAQEIGKGFASQVNSWGGGHKFTKMSADNSFVDNQYGKIYEQEICSGYNRLKVGADEHQIELMLSLCGNLNPPYFILYVLVVPRGEHEQGRYQSDLIEDISDVKAFLNEYRGFLETDGRHHIWIGTADNSGLIIYDQHNVVFCYGDLDAQILLLQNRGFKEMPFSFPVPHAHHYSEANDEFETKLLQHWDWEVFPLTADDTYD
jgi:hypothetical protein